MIRPRQIAARGLPLLLALKIGCGAPSRGALHESAVSMAASRDPRAETLNETDPGEIDDATRKLLSEPLTIDAAVKIALLNNRRLAARLSNLGLARANLLSASAVSNPVLESEVRFRPSGREPAVELSLTQRISDLFYRPKLRGAGASELEAVKLEAAGAIVDLAFEARSAFARHQADAQRLELWRTVLTAEDARLEAASALHAAGNITDLTYLTERDLFERAKIGVAAAEAEVIAGRERLNVVLGLWGKNASWTVVPRLPDLPPERPSFDGFENRAIEASLDLRAFEHRIAAASDRSSVAAWSAAFPGVELGIAAHREEEETEWEVGPRLEIALPLFDQQAGAIAREEANLERLHAEYAAQAIEVRAAARAVAADVSAAYERAVYYREVILPLRTRIVDETHAAVNAMTAGVFQLLQAQRDQIAAGLEYVAALERYWAADAASLQVRGGRIANTPMMEASPSPTPASSSREEH